MPASRTALLAVAFPYLLAIGIGAPASAYAGKSSLLAGASGFAYWNVENDSAAPKTLSAMGLYQDITAKRKILVANAVRYEVNTPQWSDGAKQNRWVLLKAGTKIRFKETDDYWDYPDSAVFVNDLFFDTIPGDTATRRLWETQVMINKKDIPDAFTKIKQDHWYGYSYKWDANQKEARLVEYDGKDDSIRILPQGLGKPALIKKWRFLSRAQCVMCHRPESADTLHGRSALGFFTAQLNRPSSLSPDMNQLDDLFAQGILSGSKPANWTGLPRWRAIEDSAATVDTRARSYIAANCSGCHGARGAANGASFNVDLDFDFHTMESKQEFRHGIVNWSYDLERLEPFFYPRTAAYNVCQSDSLRIEPALVVPGYPQKSVILFRQRARDTIPGNYSPVSNQMPPLATFEVDGPATALIEKWILQMPDLVPSKADAHCPAVGVQAGIRNPAQAYFRNGNLILPPERADRRPAMIGVDGRAVALVRLSGGVYAVPKATPKGLYYLRIGGKTLLRGYLSEE